MAVGVTPGELRELTDEDLQDRLRESKEELFNLRFQMATGQLPNNRRLRVVRQEIARMYTVLRERELGLASGPTDEES
ncbi:MAG: 50S ribosomal protein L29 [Mycobacterium sp.]